MIIEVDDDCADQILVANLVWAYNNLNDSLKHPDNYHPDDIALWKELVPAMHMVGSWYSVDFDAELKKAKKKKK
jgi:hypothetical protein